LIKLGITVFIKNLRAAIAIAILLFQVGAIIYARFYPTRFFSSAPNDAITKFKVQVISHDRKLTEEEIQKRYRFFKYGFDDRSPAHIFDIISQYETTYGKNEHAKVTVTYSENGKAQQSWEYEH
jgi:hypothetical protein